MATVYSDIVRWVALHVLPREPAVRGALRRCGLAEADVDDLIQDAYCRIATLKSVDHIENPGAYFMQVAKNLHRDNLRRANLVKFEDIAVHAHLVAEGDGVALESQIAAREQLRLISALLMLLPHRCREIFTLRRIEGLSQKDIARRLGVSESVVENDVQKALRLIQAQVRSGGLDGECVEAGREQRKFGGMS